jgi:hypothetical protein
MALFSLSGLAQSTKGSFRNWKLKPVPIVLIFATWYDKLSPTNSGANEPESVPARLGKESSVSSWGI